MEELAGPLRLVSMVDAIRGTGSGALAQSCVALAIEVGMEEASWESFILWGS